jgi:hypothetical protein
MTGSSAALVRPFRCPLAKCSGLADATLMEKMRLSRAA